MSWFSNIFREDIGGEGEPVEQAELPKEQTDGIPSALEVSTPVVANGDGAVEQSIGSETDPAKQVGEFAQVKPDTAPQSESSLPFAPVEGMDSLPDWMKKPVEPESSQSEALAWKPTEVGPTVLTSGASQVETPLSLNPLDTSTATQVAPQAENLSALTSENEATATAADTSNQDTVKVLSEAEKAEKRQAFQGRTSAAGLVRDKLSASVLKFASDGAKKE